MSKTTQTSITQNSCCFCEKEVPEGDFPFHYSCIPPQSITLFCLGCRKLRLCEAGDLRLVDQFNSQVDPQYKDQLLPRKLGQLFLHEQCSACAGSEYGGLTIIPFENPDGGGQDDEARSAGEELLLSCQYCGESVTDFGGMVLPFHQACLPRDCTTFYCRCGHLFCDVEGSLDGISRFHKEVTAGGKEPFEIKLGLCIVLSACIRCDPENKDELSYLIIDPGQQIIN